MGWIRKNLFTLIDAVTGLPSVKLYIVGDGPLREAIEERLETERIANIFLIGTVPYEKLHEELNKSEVFVLPSLYEEKSKTLLEAMACGLPAVGSDVEGINALIEHGVTGQLCGTDSRSIREAILCLIRNRDVMSRLGSNASRYVAEKYSMKKVMEKELAVHHALIKG